MLPHPPPLFSLIRVIGAIRGFFSLASVSSVRSVVTIIRVFRVIRGFFSLPSVSSVLSVVSNIRVHPWLFLPSVLIRGQPN